MAEETVLQLANRLAEHVESVKEGNILVVLHGGEPMLYPNLEYLLSTLKNKVKRVEFAIQTNGTLFTSENLEILKKYQVRIGVSIDGPQSVHDKFRVTHTGEGSYNTVLKGLSLAKFITPQTVDSILNVIDIKAAPVDVLDCLEGLNVPRADVLFPDLNYDTFKFAGFSRGELGTWLSELFDLWINRENTIHIRIFLTIIRLLLNEGLGTDQLGAYSAGALMIETDGQYDIHDGLKTAFTGAGDTGYNVSTTPVKVIEQLPLLQAFKYKASYACGTCLKCELFNVCGGGSPFHRYGIQNGFDQPSVFCEDLKIIINHIRNYLQKVVPIVNLSLNSDSVIENSKIDAPSYFSML